MSLIVDVTSDIVCPWCYIGKRQLERAVALLPDPAVVQVRWHPFLVNPNMPKEGMDRRQYRIAKFGRERASVLVAKALAAGAAAGLTFDYDLIKPTPNSLDAHRLIWLAGELGVQNAVVEAIFSEYYTKGCDLRQTDVLLDVATKGGLDRDRASALLAGDEGAAAVAAADLQARRSGVRGVPHFVVDGTEAFVGARDPRDILAVFQRGRGTRPKIAPHKVRQIDELEDMSEFDC